MTACSSCGGCCSPVSLAWTQDDVRRMMPFQIDDRTRRWVLEELHPLTRREAVAATPWLDGKQTYAVKGGRLVMTRPTYYRCDNYDPGTRQCTAYDDRPGVCRDHPTYGQPVNPGASLPPGCSYRADIGQPVDPDWTPVTLRAP
jgi:Fe-S-cluster containining protein